MFCKAHSTDEHTYDYESYMNINPVPAVCESWSHYFEGTGIVRFMFGSQVFKTAQQVADTAINDMVYECMLADSCPRVLYVNTNISIMQHIAHT